MATQALWLEWVEDAFPDLDSRTFFLPPVCANCRPMSRQPTADNDVLTIQSPPGQACQSKQPASVSLVVSQPSIPQPSTAQDNDIRNDSAMQRILFCLQKMSEENQEILVGMSQLQFGQYLGEPCYAAAAAELTLPASLPPALPRNWKRGDFDVLLIHRHYGLVVCEVKSFGNNLKAVKMLQQELDRSIRRNLEDAVSQLDRAEIILSCLMSDIAPGLRVIKTIAFPNLTTCQVQQAISGDPQLTQNLCQCLGTKDPADITGLCLCSDQLSDPMTPWDVSSDLLGELGHWWQRRVIGAGPDSHMTRDMYKTFVARLCGPATTVTIPCTSAPRLCVKTQCHAMSLTEECYTALITLFPEQVELLNTAPLRLFLSGPPGTGKTAMLLLMGAEWLRCGDDVYIVSTWKGSRAASSMLYHLLLQTMKTQITGGLAPGQPHLLQYDFHVGEDVSNAINHLSLAATKGSVCVIADEVEPVLCRDNFRTFCEKLRTQVSGLHLWAASCFHGHESAIWPVKYLTRPLRSPLAVVREVEQDRYITEGRIQAYRERGVPGHTDGPSVRRLYHRGQDHTGGRPADCAACGREVASFLDSLRVGTSVNALTTPTTTTFNIPYTTTSLEWRDVLVVHGCDVSGNSGMLKTLIEAGIPVRVMQDDNIDDVATARSDVVWVAHGARVRGLERKVVVYLESGFDVLFRLQLMTRCTSQLVIVSVEH